MEDRPPDPTMDERYQNALMLARNMSNNGNSREAIRDRLAGRGLDQSTVDAIIGQLPPDRPESGLLAADGPSEGWSSEDGSGGATARPGRGLKVRLWGLFSVVVGLVLIPVFLLAASLLGQVLQSIFGGQDRIVVALVALPVLISLRGWLQFITGAPFGQIAHRFDSSGCLAKLGLSLLTILSVVAYVAMLFGLFKLANWLGWR